MTRIVAIAALLCTAVTFGLALAHALELPGKSRLGRDEYVAVQTIYYPGFTWGGLIGEVGGMGLLAVLLLLPSGTAGFGWTAAALALLAGVHGTYWLFTHPVNKFWVGDLGMTKAASAFFASSRGATDGDWRALRDRWERSHVLRAVLAAGSLTALAAALIEL